MLLSALGAGLVKPGALVVATFKDFCGGNKRMRHEVRGGGPACSHFLVEFWLHRLESLIAWICGLAGENFAYLNRVLGQNAVLLSW